jgi:hypothetical protein
MPTETSEKGLVTHIIRHLTGSDGVLACGGSLVTENPREIAAGKAGGSCLFADWPELEDTVIHAMDRLEKALSPHLKQLKLNA